MVAQKSLLPQGQLQGFTLAFQKGDPKRDGLGTELVIISQKGVRSKDVGSTFAPENKFLYEDFVASSAFFDDLVLGLRAVA
ncbi:hypothetical protein EFB08_21990 [Rufibacter latericius]|uniref:Uncharacterized protein n=1 Tax=Rufibacter latericius TaxID=2487040 RepID=A0A3M9M8A7_9BACT|nr:hypothetical protein EFB08_21990 [Rufibacter latericius]